MTYSLVWRSETTKGGEYMKRIRIALAGSMLAVAVTGCSTVKSGGTPFVSQPTPGKDKALLYVYRPQTETMGFKRTYYLVADGELIGDLLHGGYIAHQASPGKITMISDVRKTGWWNRLGIAGIAEMVANPNAAKLEIETVGGETYYIRMHPEASFTHFTPTLNEVSASAAEQELSKCSLYPAPTP